MRDTVYFTLPLVEVLTGMHVKSPVTTLKVLLRDDEKYPTPWIVKCEVGAFFILLQKAKKDYKRHIRS